MTTPQQRRARALQVAPPPDPPVSLREFTQPLLADYPLTVIVRVCDLVSKVILVQEVAYLGETPIEGNTHARGPFFRVFPPACATVGNYMWCTYSLIDENDVVYNYSPEPEEEGEAPGVTEYRRDFYAALAYEAVVVTADQVTRLGWSAYPCEVTFSGEFLKLHTPAWQNENLAFRDATEAREELSEGMGGG